MTSAKSDPSSPARDSLAGLRHCRAFACEDIAEARDHIARVLQPHQLVPERAERRVHHMDTVDLAGIRISAVSFGAARIDVPPLDDYHAVIFCSSGNAWVRSGATETEISPRRAIVCRIGEPLEGRFSADCEQVVVRINAAALAAHTGLRHMTLEPVIDIGDRALLPWLVHLDTLMGNPALLRMVQSDKRIVVDYAGLLLRLLVSGHRMDAPAPSGRPVSAAVFRAEAFIAAHSGDPITLEDIAVAARTPVRTLLHGFRRFRDKSPMQHLRSVRLTQARERLLRDRTETVAGVALACGFSHLGRFSREYARAFGELPSETRVARRSR